jgi:hypothetical protein
MVPTTSNHNPTNGVLEENLDIISSMATEEEDFSERNIIIQEQVKENTPAGDDEENARIDEHTISELPKSASMFKY